jgi:hypothetical protein
MCGSLSLVNQKHENSDQTAILPNFQSKVPTMCKECTLAVKRLAAHHKYCILHSSQNKTCPAESHLQLFSVSMLDKPSNAILKTCNSHIHRWPKVSLHLEQFLLQRGSTRANWACLAKSLINILEASANLGQLFKEVIASFKMHTPVLTGWA